MDKKIKVWVWILVLFLVYFFFFRWESQYSFSAKDLEVKNITNKSDFENIIVKWLYDKIVKSCKKPEPDRYYWWWGGWWFGASIKESVKWNSGWWWIRWWTEEVRSWIKWNDWWWGSFSSFSFKGKEQKIETTKKVGFSKTNLQKLNVDEWDILKQTKDYIFYFSNSESKIFIIKAPNWKNKNLENVEILTTIEIPLDLRKKAELFVSENRLVYLASKKDYENNSTIVWIYDISDLKNKQIKLVKIFETKWEYFKSRLINDNLYIISDYSLEPLKDAICGKINDEENWFGEFVEYFTWIDFSFRDKKLYEDFKEKLETYSYKFNQDELSSEGKSEKLEKINLFYTKKDFAWDISNLNFNIISVVNIEKKDTKNTQHLLFWDLKWGEIHMTLDNLYLVNSYFNKEKWSCNFKKLCFIEDFESWNFTSVSKLGLLDKKLEYKKTKIIPWKPINQYSMDEDKWYFRIFTTSWRNRTGTNLYVFSKEFELTWKIEKIKPREEFKSSRFIWDKVFLVTFEQIDPFFVIDLQNPAKPEIIWELKIPWYSSYLHPYWTFWDKQYLIWLWKENGSVKIDLYEVDYSKKTLWWYIWTTQKFTKILSKWKSETPAEKNPRAFVWDKQEKKLYLPFFEKYNFNWILWIKIDKDEWIKEFFRENYRDLHSLNKNNTYNANSRVWYYKWKTNKTTAFYINPYFLAFKNIIFDTKIKENKKIFFNEKMQRRYLKMQKILEERKKQKEERIRNIGKNNKFWTGSLRDFTN